MSSPEGEEPSSEQAHAEVVDIATGEPPAAHAESADKLPPPPETHAPPADATDGAQATQAADAAETTALAVEPGMESPRLQSIVESLVFAADKPLSLREIGELVGESDLGRVRAALAGIEETFAERGMQLHGVAGGYQFRTHPINAVWVQKMLAQKPVRMTRSQLETLAIAAYRQPITRPEIDEIRGVDSGGTLKTLLDRSLVRILGKKEEVGRPLLYGTTREFLEFFNLQDLKDLPTLREYHELSEEHQAQVAALEGKAPAGSIDPPGTEEAAPLPALTRLEVQQPTIDDSRELAEIDDLINQAGGVGFVSDSDLAGEPAQSEDDETLTKVFETPLATPVGEGSEAVREFDSDSAPTRLHHTTMPPPDVDEAEFERGDTTSRRPRPEGLDDDEEPAEKDPET